MQLHVQKALFVSLEHTYPLEICWQQNYCILFEPLVFYMKKMQDDSLKSPARNLDIPKIIGESCRDWSRLEIQIALMTDFKLP